MVQRFTSLVFDKVGTSTNNWVRLLADVISTQC